MRLTENYSAYSHCQVKEEKERIQTWNNNVIAWVCFSDEFTQPTKELESCIKIYWT